MNAVFTIIDIVMWVVFGLSLLFGFLRGMKKSIVHTIVTILVIILATVFTTPVASLLTNIKIQGQGLEDLIKSYLTELSESASGTVSDYVKAFAVAVLRLPVYYLLLFVGLVIIRPILKAILKPIMRKIWPDKKITETDEEGNEIEKTQSKPSFASRGIGVAITFVAFVFSFIALTSPILGAVGLVEDVVENKNLLMAEGSGEKVEEVVESDIFDTVQNSIDTLNKKPFFAIVSVFSGKNHNSQVKVLSNLLKVKTKNGTFKIKNELNCVIPIAAVVIEAKDSEDVMGVITSHKATICGSLRTSDVINIFMPLVVEVGECYVDPSDFDFKALKAIDWKKEKNNLVGIVDATLTLLDETDFNLDKPLEFLGSPKLPIALKNFGQALMDSYLIKDVALVYGNKYLQESLKESVPAELPVLLKIADLSKIDIANDFEVLGYVANNVYKMGLFTGEEFDPIKSRLEIHNLIVLAFDLSSIKGNESELVQELLDYTGFSEQLDDFGITFNYSVDWKVESGILAQVVYNMLQLCADVGETNFDDADMLELFMDNKMNPIVGDTLALIVSSKLFNINITKLIVNLIALSGVDTTFEVNGNTYDILEYVKDVDLKDRNWTNELTSVDSLVNALQAIDGGSAGDFRNTLNPISGDGTICGEVAEKILHDMDTNGD